MKKRVIALILAVITVMLAFSLAGCGGKGGEETSTREKIKNESVSYGSEESRTSFIMGIDPEYPPFSYMGDDGEYTGFDVEVCKAVCDYLGWDFEVFGVNWDQ